MYTENTSITDSSAVDDSQHEQYRHNNRPTSSVTGHRLDRFSSSTLPQVIPLVGATDWTSTALSGRSVNSEFLPLKDCPVIELLRILTSVDCSSSELLRVYFLHECSE